VFRRAVTATRIGDIDIASGERVILMLASANRDPLVFDDPDRLDLSRDASRHLALGRGLHSCVGASIIRLATSVATDALLGAVRGAATVDGVEWLDGFAIRAPSSLFVTLPS